VLWNIVQGIWKALVDKSMNRPVNKEREISRVSERLLAS
jgi:hypothetical protein